MSSLVEKRLNTNFDSEGDAAIGYQTDETVQYEDAAPETELLPAAKREKLVGDYVNELQQKRDFEDSAEEFQSKLKERAKESFLFGAFVDKAGKMIGVLNVYDKKDDPDGAGWNLVSPRNGRVADEKIVEKWENSPPLPSLGPSDVLSTETLCCADGTAYNVIVLKGEDNYVVTDTEGNLYLPLDEIVEHTKVEYAKKLDEAREKVNEAMQHIETEENEKVPALVG